MRFKLGLRPQRSWDPRVAHYSALAAGRQLFTPADSVDYLKDLGSLGGRRKIVGFVETDPRNQDDLRRVIDECGSALVSLNLRANIAPEWEITPDVWEFDPSSPRVGRHCVNFAKYDKDGFYAESWGKNSYLVTPPCIADALDESYGVISGAWIEATGRTPLGMTKQELEVQMQGIKRAA